MDTAKFHAGQKFGPYTLIQPLGQGGLGVVWLAQKQNGQPGDIQSPLIALKLPFMEKVELSAIRKEADRWIQACQPPNVHILPVFDVGIDANQVYIASEYAPDGSLHDCLEAIPGKALSVNDAVRLGRDILDGLAHLHLRDIVHRDVKPKNILLKCGVACLADFGLARAIGVDPLTTVFFGTFSYMSPEAWLHGRDKDVDLWAATVTLYQMLSGKPPFLGRTRDELHTAITKWDPAPLPDTVPQPLRHVIQKALQKKLSVRFQSAKDLLAAIDEAVSVRADQPVTVTLPVASSIRFDRLLALAKPSHQIRPVSVDGRTRGMGGAQESLLRRYPLGSRIAITVESDRSGHLLLLDEGPEKTVYCLCPSWFAPDTAISAGRTYLPQSDSGTDSFVLEGKPGRENLLAIISKQPLVSWLPPDPETPARVLSEADVSLLVQKLQELPATEWLAMSTYFDVVE